MDNVNNEIEQFDLLAQSGSNESLDEELLSIRQFDVLMRNQQLNKTVSKDFTSQVLFDVFKAKRRKSRNRFFALLSLATATPLLLIIVLSTPHSWETLSIPSVNQLLDQWLSYFENPQMKQLFIVLEAIFCLLIIDKFFFSRANIKPSMS